MSKRSVIFGTKKGDVLTGTGDPDIMFGKKGNDVLKGLDGKDFLFGGKGDDKLFGGSGKDFLFGGKGNDKLFGGDDGDFLFGGKGNDKLFGGAGNDFLFGDKGNDKLFGGAGNDFLFGDKGNDFLDGGAGDDRAFGGKGKDVLSYSMSANLGAGFTDIGTRDYYDGGKGRDTLQLELTYGEQLLDSVQDDIAALNSFLANNSNDHSDKGQAFQFSSFDLTVRNIEALAVKLVNTEPTARADVGSTDEDTAFVIAAPGVLANDTDPDHLDVLTVIGADRMSAFGAEVLVGADGSLSYNPTAAIELQELPEGAVVVDSFSYTIADLAGATATATVSITVTGVNDDPIAMDDELENLIAAGGGGSSGPIKVAVLGVAGRSNHGDARDQLNDALFSAEAIDYTDTIVGGWGARLSGFDVVVLGAADSNDYGLGPTGTTDLFAALKEFVSAGGGVVTTGWFAQALSLMNDSIQNSADFITPITTAGYSYSSNVNGTPPNDTITVDPDLIPNEITGSIGTFQSGGRFGWELAKEVDSGAGTVRLADGVAGDGDNPGDFGTSYAAIAYATNVGQDDTVPGKPGGNTVYLGGMYVASDAYVTDATRGPVQDAIFEQAIAWAAGARTGGAATVTIDPADLLFNDKDIDSPRDGFTFESFTQPGAEGASIEFVDGVLVYTLGAQGLADLQAGIPVTDSFDYKMSDGDGGLLSTASVTLSIDNLI